MTTNTIRCWLKKINETEDWLTPKLQDISDQSLILDRDKTIKRIAEAIKLGQHIIAVGDTTTLMGLVAQL
jgi:hypothetical protein